MNTLIKLDPYKHQPFYDFEEETQLDKMKVLILGNRHFEEFGDEDLIQIVKESESEEEALEMLLEETRSEWGYRYIRGYAQGDWQKIYFEKGYFAEEKEIEVIQDFYFGGVCEYYVKDDDCYCIIPDTYSWDGEKGIAEYLGMLEIQIEEE